ncbi:MAG: Hint domain-containing protein [Pyrinomonadaceae bacterium]|nr:Hint domain-containing protein [Pyrinomonadaceae bacterium]
MLELRVEGEAKPIGVTSEHPFFLQAGDQIRTSQGRWVKILSIRPKGEARVYNFTVAENHNYFVGDLRLLTHNTNKCWSRVPKSLQDEMTLEAAENGAGQKIIDNLGDPNFKGMEKWEYKVKSENGNDSVVHYVRDPATGKLMDFKFTKHSTGEIP